MGKGKRSHRYQVVAYFNGLDSEGPTLHALIPTPTQVTQKYHRHKQIIGQRYLGGWPVVVKNPSFSSPAEITMPAIISNFR